MDTSTIGAAFVANQVLTVAGLAVVAGGVWAVRRMVKGRKADEVLTPVAAAIATAVAMSGMWKFFGDVLGASGPLRVGLFAFIEVAMVTSAVRARRNVKEGHPAGVDGMAVWALTALSAVLAATDASSVRAGLLRLSAPIVAAWLWERGLAVERRRVKGGRARIHWRVTPERVLVRLGLAEAADRSAVEVDAHRRLSKLARAAKRVRLLRAAGARGWRLRRALVRLDAAMDAAVEHAGLSADPDRQRALLDQIGVLYNAGTLAELTPSAPWEALPVRAGTGPDRVDGADRADVVRMDGADGPGRTVADGSDRSGVDGPDGAAWTVADGPDRSGLQVPVRVAADDAPSGEPAQVKGAVRSGAVSTLRTDDELLGEILEQFPGSRPTGKQVRAVTGVGAQRAARLLERWHPSGVDGADGPAELGVRSG